MKIRNLFIMGVMAFAVSAITSCEGSNSNDIPTDGILGELPSLNEKYLAEQENMRAKIEAEENDDKLTKLKAEFKEWQKAREDKLNEIEDALDGKEIPTEVADGAQFTIDGNMKLKKTSITAYRSAQIVYATFAAQTTTDLPGIMEIPEYSGIAYDIDGNVIDVCPGARLTRDIGSYRDGVPAGAISDVQIPLCRDNQEGWAKLAKIVIIDGRSDAYNQIKEQVQK